MTRAADRSIDVPHCVLLAEVERSDFVESRHIGTAVVVGPDGTVVRALGDVDARIYPRSTLKPFQTAASLRAGARLAGEQLVIVTASHSGEPDQVRWVRNVLTTHELTESDLQTPAAWPFSAEAARALAIGGGSAAPIYMNCSGNHAGMLAGAQAAGWSTRDYLAAEHPVHDLARSVIEEYCGAPAADRGVDGCGGPVWSLPLSALAVGYHRVFAALPALADAIRSFPTLIEGAATATAIETLGIVAKSGAEGVWCAVAPNGTSVAVKVLDGAARAAAAVGVALLADVGAVDSRAAEHFLDDVQHAVLGGSAAVGRVRPVLGAAR